MAKDNDMSELNSAKVFLTPFLKSISHRLPSKQPSRHTSNPNHGQPPTAGNTNLNRITVSDARHSRCWRTAQQMMLAKGSLS